MNSFKNILIIGFVIVTVIVLSSQSTARYFFARKQDLYQQIMTSYVRLRPGNQISENRLLQTIRSWWIYMRN